MNICVNKIINNNNLDNMMNTNYESCTAGKVPTSSHGATVFVIDESIQEIFSNFLNKQQLSIGVEGLSVVKAPISNIKHGDFFDHDENVVALANHLKLEHEKLCLRNKI